jgi:hypothetical protein
MSRMRVDTVECPTAVGELEETDIEGDAGDIEDDSDEYAELEHGWTASTLSARDHVLTLHAFAYFVIQLAYAMSSQV